MSRPYYEERQTFAPWVYLTLFATMVAATGVLIAVSLDDEKRTVFVYAIIRGVIFTTAFLCNMMFLVTRVTDKELYVRLGMYVPLTWRHIPLDDIRESRAVQYSPFRDAGGWGKKNGWFEGVKVRFYNARGDRGVFLKTSTYSYIIGSKTPERLQAALEQARGQG